MNKRGIGVVVVSVLIIFITVAALVITWYWVVPWLNDMETSQDTHANLRIVLEGYTAYDAEHGIAFVQIKRGADDSNPVAMDVIFNVNGIYHIFRTKNIPGNNGIAMYYFNFTDAGIDIAPQFVKVAAVFSGGSEELLGIAMGEVTIPDKDVKVDDWEEIGLKAKDNTYGRPSGNTNDPVEPPVANIEPVDFCKNDFQAGETYPVDKDYVLTSGATCFDITVSDVVLDFGGHTITGNYSGYGVRITGDNVIVKNGRIEKFEKGVFIDRSAMGNDDNQILDNDFFNNYYSIYVLKSFGNIISGNNMTKGNFSNIYLDFSGGNIVEDNWACGSPNDFRCDSSYAGVGGIWNTGTGNVFQIIVDCSDTLWGTGGGGYTACP